MRSAVLTGRDLRATAGVPARAAARRHDRARLVRTPRSPAGGVERGARPLVDGAAIADQPVGSLDWLASEILGARGDAIVLEPADLRTHVAERARALLDELAAAQTPRPSASGRVERQRQREGRAAVRDRLDDDAAAVRLGDRAGDVEAEAGAGLGLVAELRPAELLEDQALLLRRDARPAIADRHLARGRSRRGPRPGPRPRPAST